MFISEEHCIIVYVYFYLCFYLSTDMHDTTIPRKGLFIQHTLNTLQSDYIIFYANFIIHSGFPVLQDFY